MDHSEDLQSDGSPVIDCGVASVETKGFPFMLLPELAPPPFDRTQFV